MTKELDVYGPSATFPDKKWSVEGWDGEEGVLATITESSDPEGYARLFAAAPELKKQRDELLAAAEAAVPWLVKMIADGGHEQTVNPSNCVRALEGLEAAIAAAKGK